jgi:hypothetical protein
MSDSTVLLIVLCACYWFPTYVGVIRRVPNLGSVIVVNLFGGWTFLGWVIALAMAFRSTRPQKVVVTHLGGEQPWKTR